MHGFGTSDVEENLLGKEPQLLQLRKTNLNYLGYSILVIQNSYSPNARQRYHSVHIRSHSHFDTKPKPTPLRNDHVRRYIVSLHIIQRKNIYIKGCVGYPGSHPPRGSGTLLAWFLPN